MDAIESEYIAIILPPEYPYVMLVAGIVAFEVLLVGFLGPGRERSKYFSKQFMEENFGRQIMDDPTLKQEDTRNLKGGYPDMGSGRYSDKFTYEQWFSWNRLQRGHLNFLETVTIVCFLTLITGMELPWLAIGLCGTYGLFRPLFFMKNRLVGFVPGVLCTFGLFFASLYTCFVAYGKTYVDLSDQATAHHF